MSSFLVAGINVDYAPKPELDGVLPDAVSRAAFRVVQKGVTNVARHAPGAKSAVRLKVHPFEPQGQASGRTEAASPGTGPRQSGLQELRITVSNGPGTEAEPALGAGVGLVGLAERIQLLGGTLEHGTLEYGPTGPGSQLVASIPFNKAPQDQQDLQEGTAQ